MREIKFRQWLGAEFHYWGVNIESNDFVGAGSCNKLNAGNTVHQQFTGLYDKKGKEIYEGDILTSLDYPFYSDGELNYVGEVAWDDEELCYFYDIHVVSDRVCGRACGGSLSDHSDWEVIGNTFETPELLEVAHE